MNTVNKNQKISLIKVLIPTIEPLFPKHPHSILKPLNKAWVIAKIKINIIPEIIKDEPSTKIPKIKPNPVKISIHGKRIANKCVVE